MALVNLTQDEIEALDGACELVSEAIEMGAEEEFQKQYEHVWSAQKKLCEARHQKHSALKSVMKKINES